MDKHEHIADPDAWDDVDQRTPDANTQIDQAWGGDAMIWARWEGVFCGVKVRWGQVNLAGSVVQGGEDYGGNCDGEQQTALASRELMPDTLVDAVEFLGRFHI